MKAGGSIFAMVSPPDSALRKLLLPAAVALLLLACGAERQDEAGLPSYSPFYPGAEIKTQLNNNDGEGKHFVLLSTPDPVSKVIAFYDKEARDNGARAGMRVTKEDKAVRLFQHPESQSSMMVVVRNRQDDLRTEILLMSGNSEMEMDADMGGFEEDTARRERKPALPRLQ